MSGGAPLRCKICHFWRWPLKPHDCSENISGQLTDFCLQMDRAHNSGYCKCQEECFSVVGHNCSETCDHCFDIKEGIEVSEEDDRNKYLMALVDAQKQSKQYVETETGRQNLIAFLEKVPHECPPVKLMAGVSRYSYNPDCFWPVFKDVSVPEEAQDIIEKHLTTAFAEIRETFLPKVTG